MSSTDREKLRAEREAARRRQIWTAQEVLDQIELTRTTPGAGGNVHFSMKTFMRDSGHVNEALINGPYKDQSLVPASTWLDDKAPGMPALKLKRDGDKLTAHWSPKWELFGGEKPWLWAMYVKRGDRWQCKVYPAEMRSMELPGNDAAGALSAVAVSQVDTCGNESKRNVQEVK